MTPEEYAREVGDLDPDAFAADHLASLGDLLLTGEELDGLRESRAEMLTELASSAYAGGARFPGDAWIIAAEYMPPLRDDAERFFAPAT